jgi:hypothetical protein
MKTIKKNVYYCDHCKKRSLSASHMKKHEVHCTANPDRKCGLCGRTEPIRELITGYKARFIVETQCDETYDFDFYKITWVGKPITLNEIRDAVDGCPNCMLSVIRQSELNRYFFGDTFKFDYKAENRSYFCDNFIKPDLESDIL